MWGGQGLRGRGKGAGSRNCQQPGAGSFLEARGRMPEAGFPRQIPGPGEGASDLSSAGPTRTVIRTPSQVLLDQPVSFLLPTELLKGSSALIIEVKRPQLCCDSPLPPLIPTLALGDGRCHQPYSTDGETEAEGGWESPKDEG